MIERYSSNVNREPRPLGKQKLGSVLCIVHPNMAVGSPKIKRSKYSTSDRGLGQEALTPEANSRGPH